MYAWSQCSCRDHYKVSWQHSEQDYAENRNTRTNNSPSMDTIHKNTQWDKCPLSVLRPTEDNPVSNSLLEQSKVILCWGRYHTVFTIQMYTWHQGLSSPYFNPLCGLFWLSASENNPNQSQDAMAPHFYLGVTEEFWGLLYSVCNKQEADNKKRQYCQLSPFSCSSVLL